MNKNAADETLIVTSFYHKTLMPCIFKIMGRNIYSRRLYLNSSSDSSLADTMPFRTSPDEWLDFRFTSAANVDGTFLFLPNSFLNGWNLPCFFFSVNCKIHIHFYINWLLLSQRLNTGTCRLVICKAWSKCNYEISPAFSVHAYWSLFLSKRTCTQIECICLHAWFKLFKNVQLFQTRCQIF